MQKKVFIIGQKTQPSKNVQRGPIRKHTAAKEVKGPGRSVGGDLLGSQEDARGLRYRKVKSGERRFGESS